MTALSPRAQEIVDQVTVSPSKFGVQFITETGDAEWAAVKEAIASGLVFRFDSFGLNGKFIFQLLAAK